MTSDESPPEIHAADVVVDGPAGLAVLLDALADAISARLVEQFVEPGARRVHGGERAQACRARRRARRRA